MGVANDAIQVKCNQRRSKAMRELNQQERQDIVRYRMDNAYGTLNEIRTHIENGFYNTAVNRMYYACYYAASALLVANKVVTKSHEGVKQMFSFHFVKTGKVSEEYGKFYSRLFEKRTKGDYEDLFDNDLAVCEEYFPKTEDFVEAIGQLVSDWANDQM